jgi:hypothetical protein
MSAKESRLDEAALWWMRSSSYSEGSVFTQRPTHWVRYSGQTSRGHTVSEFLRDLATTPNQAQSHERGAKQG